MSETFEPDPFDEPREWPALGESTLAELERRVADLDEHACGDDVLLWLDRTAAFTAAAKALQSAVYKLAIAWIQANGELRLGDHVRFGVGHQRVVRCVDQTATLHAALDALGGDLDGVAALLAANAWKHGACRQVLAPVAFNRLFLTEVSQARRRACRGSAAHPRRRTLRPQPLNGVRFMHNSNPLADDDRPPTMRLRIVDVIDCVAANAPDVDGRPITMLTLAYLGDLEQPLAISYDDSKRLVTKLLQSLSDHDDEFATELLERYFEPRGGRDDAKDP